jgi:hypothetical protein
VAFNFLKKEGKKHHKQRALLASGYPMLNAVCFSLTRFLCLRPSHRLNQVLGRGGFNHREKEKGCTMQYLTAKKKESKIMNLQSEDKQLKLMHP